MGEALFFWNVSSGNNYTKTGAKRNMFSDLFQAKTLLWNHWKMVGKKKKKRETEKRKEKMDIQICCALRILSENHKLVISAALRVCPERIKQIYFNESCTSFWIFQHVGLMDEGRSFLDVQWCNPINHQTSQSRQRTLSAFNLWRSNLHFHLMENLIYQERFHSLLQCDCQDKPGALPYLCSRLFR